MKTYVVTINTPDGDPFRKRIKGKTASEVWIKAIKKWGHWVKSVRGTK